MLFREDFHDAALVWRVRAGDLFALDVLIERYQRVLYSVALGIRTLSRARQRPLDVAATDDARNERDAEYAEAFASRIRSHG